MANTNMDVLYPEYWATVAETLDVGSYDLPRLVSNRNELTAGNMYQQVNVPLTADLGDAVAYDTATPVTPTAISQEAAQVVLNRSFGKAITLTRQELTHSAVDLVKTYMPGLMKALMKQMSLDVYLAGLQSEYVVDARTTFDHTKIAAAYGILDLNEVSEDMRVLVSGPEAYKDMLTFDSFTRADFAGNPETLRTAQLPERYGFRIAKDHSILKYTPADVTGAINNGAGYTSADFTIAVDAFNDDARPLRVGDLFTVASESGSPIHSVVSTTTTSSDTTGITFRTINGMTNAAKADDAVVTVSPTSSLLAMHPSAIAFASRPYANLPSGVGANQQVMTLPNGVNATLSIWQDGLVVQVQMDALWGVTMVHRKRCARIVVD